MTKRILVCGGRTFGAYVQGKPEHQTVSEQNFIKNILYSLPEITWYGDDENEMPGDVHIIAGGAHGADTVAVDWAVVNWLPFTEYPANWDLHGKAAGHIRNTQMLVEGKPDLVVAFPGGRGTENMKQQARKAGIEVREFVLAK